VIRNATVATFNCYRAVCWRNVWFLSVVYVLVAAATYCGFYNKWRLKDGSRRDSAIHMLDGDAYRPFVYRQFMPLAAILVDRIAPKFIKERFLAKLFSPLDNPSGMQLGLRHGDIDDRVYSFRYYVEYNFGFVLLLASMLLMRYFCSSLGCSRLSSTIAPAIVALSLPVLQSKGGYIYDFSELFFFFASLCLIMSRYRWFVVPLAILGTLNKESYVFFLLTIVPLVRPYRIDRAGTAVLTCSLATAGLVYLGLKMTYAGNPGANVEFHLPQTLLFYMNPLNLLAVETTYGIVMFAGYSFVSVLTVGMLISLGWRRFDRRLKLYALACATINVPLVLLFAAPGETRNLSLLYPTLLLLIAFVVEAIAGGEQMPNAGLNAPIE
jgi:hypothetical protein